MEGAAIAELMLNGDLRKTIHRIAKRYTRNREDQEEFAQDAWLRIAGCTGDKTYDFYCEEARRAINAARMRKAYSVQKKNGKNLHGYSEGVKEIPKDAKELYRNKYIGSKPVKLSEFLYDEECEQYGLTKSDLRYFSFYEIYVKGQ